MIKYNGPLSLGIQPLIPVNMSVNRQLNTMVYPGNFQDLMNYVDFPTTKQFHNQWSQAKLVS